jgi:hypothetical protein
MQYVLGNRDPRRSQPIIDFIVSENRTMEYNQELSFDGKCDPIPSEEILRSISCQNLLLYPGYG